jgi:hypothetical protein
MAQRKFAASCRALALSPSREPNIWVECVRRLFAKPSAMLIVARQRRGQTIVAAIFRFQFVF